MTEAGSIHTRGSQQGGGWNQHPRATSAPSSSTEGQPHPSPYRCPLKTLQKCEIALEKLKNDMAVVSGALWPGAVQRASGIFGKTGPHHTATQNHKLGEAFTVRSG